MRPRRLTPRRLGLRIALMMVLCFLVFEVALIFPLWVTIDSWLHPEVAEYYAEAWTPWDPWIYGGFLVLYAILIGGALALIVSRVATRRLERLARAAEHPISEQDLGPPLPVEGHDEIAQLAGSMNSMRDRLGELVARLADRDAKRREWVAQVSHDLRTPLAACLVGVDRARMHLEQGGAPSELDDLLAEARVSAGRVQALADDLLEIARLEANDPLQLEPILPGELVQRTVHGLRPLAGARGVTLEDEVPGGLHEFEGDGRRLARALENLIANAVQHAAARVAVVVERGADHLRFLVRDDGNSLPDDADYDALERSRSRADSAGLGLRVTRCVAAAHGGSVGARRTRDGGAAVWFDVPLA